jgi:hypothetical protein
MNLQAQFDQLQQQQQQLINERQVINEQLENLAPFQARLKVCERELANTNGALAIVQMLLKEAKAEAETAAEAPPAQNTEHKKAKA